MLFKYLWYGGGGYHYCGSEVGEGCPQQAFEPALNRWRDERLWSDLSGYNEAVVPASCSSKCPNSRAAFPAGRCYRSDHR
jgi:hypothetical protein